LTHPSIYGKMCNTHRESRKGANMAKPTNVVVKTGLVSFKVNPPERRRIEELRTRIQREFPEQPINNSDAILYAIAATSAATTLQPLSIMSVEDDQLELGIR